MRTDFKRVIYIGLDIAETMGVAVLPKANDVAFVSAIKGTPTEQLNVLMAYLLEALPENSEPIFVIERLHNFVNKNTVRSLSERAGYLKHSLLSFGYQVREAGVSEARKLLGTKDKESTFMLFVPKYNGSMLTSDHTDALVVALYAKHKDTGNTGIESLSVQGVSLVEGETK